MSLPPNRVPGGYEYTTAEIDEVYPPCRCGREIRKLNAASDTPKCVGCGYTEELCRCDGRTCGACLGPWPGVVDQFGQHSCRSPRW